MTRAKKMHTLITPLFKVAGIIEDSVVDGEGVRMTVFFQGCSHHCQGCHNQATWDPDKKCHEMTVQEIVDKFKENPLQQGVTLSGGEPLEQSIPLLTKLVDAIHEAGGDVWLYTGYTLVELLRRGRQGDSLLLDLLHKVNYIVDGPFKEKQRDLSLTFRGSRNQGIWETWNGQFIDVTSKF